MIFTLTLVFVEQTLRKAVQSYLGFAVQRFLLRNLVVSNFMFNFAPKETREIMATTLKKSNGMTPMQLHLVSMLNFNSTEAAEQRLKTALEQFYLSEFEKMKEEMRTSGALTEDIIAEGAAKHFRTLYYPRKS